ncbi:hypothetical protein QU38_01665, partial [Staphylococcus aureus]
LGDALAGIGAIGLLGAEPARGDHQLAARGQLGAGQRLELLIGVWRQPQPEHVDPQLDGGGDLVDVLPARPGRGEELLLDDRLVGDFNHGRTRPRTRPRTRHCGSAPAAGRWRGYRPCPRAARSARSHGASSPARPGHRRDRPSPARPA